MSNELEKRIADLEQEVAKLRELVGTFRIEKVDGDVNLTITGSLQGLSVSASEIGNDLCLTTGQISGMRFSSADVGNNLCISLSGANAVSIEADDVGNDISITANGGNVKVDAGSVGGEIKQKEK